MVIKTNNKENIPKIEVRKIIIRDFKSQGLMGLDRVKITNLGPKLSDNF